MKHTDTSKDASLDRLRITARMPEAQSAPVRSTVAPLVAVALLCLALGAGAMWTWRQAVPPATVRSAATQLDASSDVATDAAGAGQTLSVTGYVVARDKTTVSAEGTGRLLKLFVHEGDKVVAGQVLAQIANDAEATRLKLVASQAQSAEVQLKEAELEQTLQQGTHLRNTELFNAGMVSAAALEQSQRQLQQTRHRREQAALEVQQAMFNRKLAQTGYDNTFVRAPFSGTVLALNAQIGEIVSPLANAGFVRSGICTIADLGSQVIEFDINEKYLVELELGQPVDAVLDAFPGRTFVARISAIRAEVDRSKATIKVQAKLDRLDASVLPDMSVRISIHRKKRT